MYRATKKAGVKIALLFVFFMPSVLYSDALYRQINKKMTNPLDLSFPPSLSSRKLVPA